MAKACLGLILVAGLPGLAQPGHRVAVWGNAQLIQGLTNITAVAGGYYASLALRADGTVVAWGANYYHQTEVPPGLSNVIALTANISTSLALRADGTVVAWGSLTELPAALTNIVAISAGWYHCLALKGDGSVVAWGENLQGQTEVPQGLSDVSAIAAGGDHSLALKRDGTLVAWGANLAGQSNVPSEATNLVAIAAGGEHNLALRADGVVLAWGRESAGQCAVPVGLSDVRTLAAGREHSLALKKDGTVVAWGSDWAGLSHVPAGLSPAASIAAGYEHSLAVVPEGPVDITENPVDQIASWGSSVTFSVTNDGREPVSYQWYRGLNLLSNGEGISGATTARLTLSAVRFGSEGRYSVAVSNAFGSMHSHEAVLGVVGPPVITGQTWSSNALAGDDAAFLVYAEGLSPLTYQWSFEDTELAGATSARLTLTNVQPSMQGRYWVRVSRLEESVVSGDMLLTVIDSAPRLIREAADRKATVGGATTFAPTIRGSLPMTYQWRFNGQDLPGATQANLTLGPLRYDQAGYYQVVARNAWGEIVTAKAHLAVVQVLVWRSSPTATSPTNVPGGLTNAIAVAAGGRHVLALRADHTLMGWESSSADGASSIPTDLDQVVAMAAGYSHNLALRANGTVVAWAAGSSALTNVPNTLARVSDIATSVYRYGGSCLALRSAGTVAAWGAPTYPVPPGLSNIVAVSAGPFQNLALQADGQAVAWGYDPQPTSFTDLIAVAAGSSYILGLRQDGTVVHSSHPARPLFGLSNVVAIAASRNFNAVLLADGSVRTWVEMGYGMGSGPDGLSNVIALAVGGSDVNSPFCVVAVGDGSPSLTVRPRNQRVPPGSNIAFHARAAGVQPMRYRWQFEGSDLPGADTPSLVLTNLAVSQDGAYRVLVANSFGSVTSAVANLILTAPLPEALDAAEMAWSDGTPDQPWFGQVRESHDGMAAARSAAIADGQQSTLATSVIGPGTLRFWWRISSEDGFDSLRLDLDATPAPQAEISGERPWEEFALAIPDGPHRIAWTYSKDASLRVGLDAAWLDQVRFEPDPPVIVVQPRGGTAWAGARVTLAVTARGAPPLSYQWFRDGDPLAVASPVLIREQATRHDAGTYTVQVANPGGRVSSSNAVLVVQTPQRLRAIGLPASGVFEFRSQDADDAVFVSEDLLLLEVQVSTNLLNWIALPLRPTLTNGTLRFLDPDSTDLPARFYRVIER